MILKSEIELAVKEQLETLRSKSTGEIRESIESIKWNQKFILIITGIRRCGKSTLMLQLSEKLKKDFAFFNFEDPRIFNFENTDFPKLSEVLGNNISYYFFDEIQNINQWEVFVRNLHDKQKSICITGSNASLLSKELGTRLTGRNIQIELFPFSFNEYCSFKKKRKNNDTFLNYLRDGGFPDYVASLNIEILQQLFKDIIYRDIVVRYNIRNSKTLVDIALFLISNSGKLYSLNNLKKVFDIGSTNSIANYVQWLEDSYILFSVPRFSWSAKNIAINQKKAYVIDTAFAIANSLSISNDSGRLLENSVYLHLRRKYKEIYYFREKGECDFIVKEGKKILQVIQVCYEMNSDNMRRELSGLIEALNFFNIEEGTIVTINQNDQLTQDGKTIHLVAAHNWFAR